MLGLTTKCSVVQKISSEQAFTNIFYLHCDLDLERSNPIFPQDTLAYDTLLPNQVWLQIDQQFRRYSKNSHILIIRPHCDLDTEDIEPIFLHDTSPHDNTSPNQVWSNKMVEQFRDTERTRSDTWTEIQMDGRTHRQSDSNITPLYLGGGGSITKHI